MLFKTSWSRRARDWGRSISIQILNTRKRSRADPPDPRFIRDPASISFITPRRWRSSRGQAAGQVHGQVADEMRAGLRVLLRLNRAVLVHHGD